MMRTGEQKKNVNSLPDSQASASPRTASNVIGDGDVDATQSIHIYSQSRSRKTEKGKLTS